MLNVDKVFTSKWMPLDNVRDYVMGIVSNLPTGVTALTTAQKEAIYAALNTSKTDSYEPTSPFADFQENNGVIIPDMQTCMDISKSYYRAALGEDIDTTSETHVGRMMEQSAILFRSALGVCAANVMQMDLNSATGRYLDALGYLFFSERKNAEATRVTAVLSNSTASAVTVLPLSCSFTDGNGVKFNLSSSIVVPAATGEVPGVAVAVFICETKGLIVPNESEISWTVPTGISGSDSFASLTIGYDVESDDDFRARLKVTRVSSVGFLPSVKSSVISLDGVYDVYVIENTSNVSATIQGVPLAPHSILTYVDYDGTDETALAVAKKIFDNKAVGCGYTIGLSSSYGTQVQKTVTDASFGTPYTVTFYKPKTIRCYVSITVTRNEYSGNDLESDIKNAIVAWANGDVPYVDGIKIGQKIKAYEIGAAVSARIPEIQIDGVLLGTASASITSTVINIAAYEIGMIGIGDITVTIVE